MLKRFPLNPALIAIQKPLFTLLAPEFAFLEKPVNVRPTLRNLWTSRIPTTNSHDDLRRISISQYIGISRSLWRVQSQTLDLVKTKPKLIRISAWYSKTGSDGGVVDQKEHKILNEAATSPLLVYIINTNAL